MDSRLRGSDGFRTFYAVSRNEAKENAVPRSNLRVIATAGARRNSPALRRAQTVRALFPVRTADVRRGTMGNKNPMTSKTVFKPLSRGLHQA
jgi:hypothetical protein